MSFELVEKRYLKDINTTSYKYVHLKTKAELLFFKNDDENKSFSISFKTIPKNDKGIFHIIEHSVLCGSKKYPLKEPFLELLKGSFNTFLNAMTFPDKTVYPVSSKDENDLKVLMDIYLDAVFNPNLLENNKIFMQEGWHYHLENLEDEISYKGVVYNEMRGVYDSIDELIDINISKNLYKNSPYMYSYGGGPRKIVNLEYKELVDEYLNCYHPSNAYIFLYGNLNINSFLKIIDEYLSEYNFKNYSNYVLNKQDNFNKNIVTVNYPNSELLDKNYFTASYLIDTNENINLLSSIEIINELLLGNSDSSFKNYFIENNICEDVYGYLQKDRLEVSYSIVFKNVKDKYIDKIDKIYDKKLNNEIKNGFNKRHIKSIIRNFVFDIKDEINKSSEPKGVNYAIFLLRNWIHKKDPLQVFDFESIINNLKDNFINNNYENIATKFILQNEKKSLIKAIPQKNNISYTKAFFEDFDENIKKGIMKKTSDFIKWQNKENSAEDLQKIKAVDSKKVLIKNPIKPLIFKNINGIRHTNYQIFTNDIIYYKFIFDISDFSEKELKYASLISYILFNNNTKNKSKLENNIDINSFLGGVDTFINVFRNSKNNDLKIKFILSAKNLNIHMKESSKIIKENLINYDFSKKDNIKNILVELKLYLDNKFKENAHLFTLQRLSSYMSKANYIKEIINGFNFYIFIKDLLKNINVNYNDISENLINTMKKILNKEDLLTISTCSEYDDKLFLDNISNITNFIKSERKYKQSNILFNPKSNKYSEAFYFNTNVQYVSLASNIKCNYNGKLLVLSNIINFDYLWNKIRIKGGAYGTGFSINRYNEIYFWSYRDPNLTKTIDIYKDISKFIENLSISDTDLNKFKIGALNTFNQLMSPNEKSSISLKYYLSDIDIKEFDKIITEIKNTKIEDLKSLKSLFENIKEKNHICVVSSKKNIEENQKIFSDTIKLE